MRDGRTNKEAPSDAAAGFCAAVVLLVNTGMAWSQFRDHFSWEAMGIAFFISPLLNCTMLFAAFLFAPADRESRTFYFSVAIALPLLLIPCQLLIFVLH
jgi:lipoprotein signal peptidase